MSVNFISKTKGQKVTYSPIKMEDVVKAGFPCFPYCGL